ncbi:hypothetical protein AAHC03_026104 [Spirometra sp. Aus1]
MHTTETAQEWVSDVAHEESCPARQMKRSHYSSTPIPQEAQIILPVGDHASHIFKRQVVYTEDGVLDRREGSSFNILTSMCQRMSHWLLIVSDGMVDAT